MLWIFEIWSLCTFINIFTHVYYYAMDICVLIYMLLFHPYPSSSLSFYMVISKVLSWAANICSQDYHCFSLLFCISIFRLKVFLACKAPSYFVFLSLRILNYVRVGFGVLMGGFPGGWAWNLWICRCAVCVHCAVNII